MRVFFVVTVLFTMANVYFGITEGNWWSWGAAAICAASSVHQGMMLLDE